MRISQVLTQKYTDEDTQKFVERLNKDLHSGDISVFEFHDPEVVPSKHIKFEDKDKDVIIDINIYVEHDSWNFKGTIYSKELHKTFYLDKHSYEGVDPFTESLIRKLREVKEQITLDH